MRKAASSPPASHAGAAEQAGGCVTEVDGVTDARPRDVRR
jgi:hypothetical protein